MEKNFEYYIEMARKAIPVKEKKIDFKKIFEKALDKKIEEIDNDESANLVINIGSLNLPKSSESISDTIASLQKAYNKAGWILSYISDGDGYDEIHLKKIGKK